MSDIKDLQMTAAASLWLKPCSFEELCKRLSKPQYGFHIIVNMAKNKGWIYEKGNILYCYKKTVKKVLNPEGYELELNANEVHETDFAKACRKAGLIQ